MLRLIPVLTQFWVARILGKLLKELALEAACFVPDLTRLSSSSSTPGPDTCRRDVVGDDGEVAWTLNSPGWIFQLPQPE